MQANNQKLAISKDIKSLSVSKENRADMDQVMKKADLSSALAPTAAVAIMPLFTAGNDTVDFNMVIAGSYVDSPLNALEGNDTVILPHTISAALASGMLMAPLGSNPNVLFNGGAGDDVISGQGMGLAYNVSGGDGNDQITLGMMNDLAFGGSGADTIRGNDGNDVLAGGAGIDSLYGGEGNDVIYGEEIFGSASNSADAGGDRIAGGNGNDLIYGQGGNDVIFGENGADRIFGGDGIDLIFGGAGGDFMYGGLGDDRMYGDIFLGDDATEGNNDIMFGNDGNDYINGQNGNDLIVGGSGSDRMAGGAGADTFVWNPVDVAAGEMDMVLDFQTGVDRLDIRNLLQGYDGNIGNFVQLAQAGASHILQVDVDGVNVNGAVWVNIAQVFSVNVALSDVMV